MVSEVRVTVNNEKKRIDIKLEDEVLANQKEI